MLGQRFVCPIGPATQGEFISDWQIYELVLLLSICSSSACWLSRRDNSSIDPLSHSIIMEIIRFQNRRSFSQHYSLPFSFFFSFSLWLWTRVALVNMFSFPCMLDKNQYWFKTHFLLHAALAAERDPEQPAWSDSYIEVSNYRILIIII